MRECIFDCVHTITRVDSHFQGLIPCISLQSDSLPVGLFEIVKLLAPRMDIAVQIKNRDVVLQVIFNVVSHCMEKSPVFTIVCGVSHDDHDIGV